MAVPGTPSQRVRWVTLALAALLMTGCGGGPSERACALLEDLPPRTEEVTVGEMEELLEAATTSERAEIREIGEEMERTLRSRQALERLAPGSSMEVLESQLRRLGEACGGLEGPAPGSPE